MSSLVKRQMLYEGKAKKIYLTNQANLLWVVYKDSATAFNGLKKGIIANKGVLNNKISSIFFQVLTDQGVSHHFIKPLSEREQLVKQASILPVEVVVRNLAAGSICKRLGLSEGLEMPYPLVEFYYKKDSLGDPLVTEDHISLLKLATEDQIEQIKTMALRVNEILIDFLVDKKLIIVDFKLEFGLDADSTLILADEISPDTCRFWDSETKEKLDKDRFRQDLGGVIEAYQEIYRRIGSQKITSK